MLAVHDGSDRARPPASGTRGFSDARTSPAPAGCGFPGAPELRFDILNLEGLATVLQHVLPEGDDLLRIRLGSRQVQEASTIERQQGRLLEAYYADAIPRALFLQDQHRIKTERARNDYERRAMESSLTELEQQTRSAPDLLQDAHETYQRAAPPIRKQLNQALFARVLLGAEPTQIRVELNEPYDVLSRANTPDNG